MKRWWIAVLGLVVAGLLVLPMVTAPSDSEMVKESLEAAVRASREGKPGGVFEHLSSSMRFNDMPLDDRVSVADFIRKSRPAIEVHQVVPEVSGNTAVVESPVTVEFQFGPVPVAQRLEKVRFTFRKETGTRFLVIPAPKWRLSDVQAPTVAVPDY
jgi:hypothetical protein